MMINGRKINVIAISFPTTCINLPRRIPFQPMNYKDALNVSINDKLTKAKLIDISNTLQKHCLLFEKPIDTQVIPMRKYYLDLRARMSIDKRERNAFIKDVFNLGRNTRKVLVTAMNNMD